MKRKLLVGLLVLAFMLGSTSIFQSKQVFSHTGPKIYHCAAEPWNEGEWNTAIPPPDSEQNQAYSSANSLKLGNKVDPRKVQQRPQRSFWSGVQFFLYNLKLLLGGK